MVSPGDKIKIEKIDQEPDKQVIFDQVLAVIDDQGKAEIGAPLVKGAKVKAKVLDQARGKKVTVLKYKSKKRYQKKKGFRQPFSQVEIISIN